MAIRYDWIDDSKTVMFINIEFPWTWDEYKTTISEIMSIIDKSDHPCATIVDTTDLRTVPKDGNIIQSLMGAERQFSDNLFGTVIVGKSYMIRVFMNVVMKMRPRVQQLTIFTETIEEAFLELQARQEALFPDALNKIKMP